MFTWNSEPWKGTGWAEFKTLAELHRHKNDLICMHGGSDSTCQHSIKLGDAFPIFQEQIKLPDGKILEEGQSFPCGYAWLTFEGSEVYCSMEGRGVTVVVGQKTDWTVKLLDSPINIARNALKCSDKVWKNSTLCASGSHPKEGDGGNTESNMIGMDRGFWSLNQDFKKTIVNNYRTPTHYMQTRSHGTELLLNLPFYSRRTFYHEVAFDDFVDSEFLAFYNMNEFLQFNLPKLPPEKSFAILPYRVADTSGNFCTGYFRKATDSLKFHKLDMLKSLAGYLGKGVYFEGNGHIRTKAGCFNSEFDQMTWEFAVEVLKDEKLDLNILELPGSWKISLLESGQIQVKLVDKNGNLFSRKSKGSLNKKQWNHVMISFSNKRLRFFFNGKWGGSVSIPEIERINRSIDHLYIGPSNLEQESSGSIIQLDEIAISRIARPIEYAAFAAMRYRRNLDFQGSTDTNKVLRELGIEIPSGLANSEVRLPKQIVEWRNSIPLEERKSRFARMVDFGKLLFNSTSLSINSQNKSGNKVSCASCHIESFAFASNRKTAPQVGGGHLPLNTPTLINRLFSTIQFYDGRSNSIFDQVIHPVENPKEMGGEFVSIIEEISTNNSFESIRTAFNAAFPGKPHLTKEDIQMGLTAFTITRFSKESPVDKLLVGDTSMGEELRSKLTAGYQLFQGKARCTACHAGPNFTDETFSVTGSNVLSLLSLRGAVTNKLTDFGAVKVPSLREISKTAPYFHDGSMPTLRSVIEFYNRGGNKMNNLDHEMFPLGLNDKEIDELVFFLMHI